MLVGQPPRDGARGGCRDLGADRQPAQLEAVRHGRPVGEVQHPDPALSDGDRSRGLPRACARLDAPRGHAVPRLHHRGPAQLLRRERGDARRVREASRPIPRAAPVGTGRQRAARQAQPVAAAVRARQGDQRGHQPGVQLDPLPRGHRDARRHQGRARPDGLLGRRDLRCRGSRTRGSTASRSSRCPASPTSRSSWTPSWSRSRAAGSGSRTRSTAARRSGSSSGRACSARRSPPNPTSSCP